MTQFKKLCYVFSFISFYGGSQVSSSVNYPFLTTDINPSSLSTTTSLVFAKQSTITNTSNTKAETNGVDDNRSYSENETMQSVLAVRPLGGGAAIGITGSYISKDLEATIGTQSREFNETERRKEIIPHFIVDLTPQLKGSFSYRYVRQDMDVLGEFNISESDRTTYRSNLTGFILGVTYTTPQYAISGRYDPPIKGKADVQAEEKIISEPGHSTLAFQYNHTKFQYRIRYRRWFHKTDDRSSVATSMVDQRGMSLRGLSIEQFMLDVSQITLGLQYTYDSHLKGLIELSQYDRVLLFEQDALPGDDKDDETAFKKTQYSAEIQYKYNQFDFSIGYQMSSETFQDATDSSQWLSTRTYLSHSSNTTNVLLGINVTY